MKTLIGNFLDLAFLAPRALIGASEMGLAATQVVGARLGIIAELFLKPNSKAIIEIYQMTGEKFIGSVESASSAARATGKFASPRKARKARKRTLDNKVSSTTLLALPWHLTAANTRLMVNIMSFPLTWLARAIYVLEQTIFPLRQRLMANAKRLSLRKNRKSVVRRYN